MTIPADGFQIIGIVEQGHITLVRLLVVDGGWARVSASRGKYHAAPLALVLVTGQDDPAATSW